MRSKAAAGKDGGASLGETLPHRTGLVSLKVSTGTTCYYCRRAPSIILYMALRSLEVLKGSIDALGLMHKYCSKHLGRQMIRTLLE